MTKQSYENAVLDALDDDNIQIELYRKGNKIGVIKNIETENAYREKVFDEFTLFERTFTDKDLPNKTKVFVLQLGTGFEIEFDDFKKIG
jgi:hypothetical protein